MGEVHRVSMKLDFLNIVPSGNSIGYSLLHWIKLPSALCLALRGLSKVALRDSVIWKQLCVYYRPSGSLYGLMDES